MFTATKNANRATFIANKPMGNKHFTIKILEIFLDELDKINQMKTEPTLHPSITHIIADNLDESTIKIINKMVQKAIEIKTEPKNHPPTQFSKQDLIDFGHYLLSDERTEMIINHPDQNNLLVIGRLKNVSHADFENWLESKKTLYQFFDKEGVTLMYEVIASDTIEAFEKAEQMHGPEANDWLIKSVIK